jgi:3-methylfumaryl-CoA hydratase
LNADGHPAHGSLLPPVELPRRMYAGGQLTWHAPLPIAAPLRRSSAVVSVRPKVGRSGRLVFVTVEHRVGPPAQPEALVERTDLVFREPADPNRPARSARSEPDGSVAADWPWSWDLAIEPTLLFRFSALTYNAHRIHYDRPYATGVEGYPGLVVHGPLQAVALAELCRRHDPRPLTTFRFAALAPAFDDGPVRLRGRPDGTDGVVLRALDVHGGAVMEAAATFAP